MIKGMNKSPSAKTLDETAAELAVFWKEVHSAYPQTEIGLITNFPNWDYDSNHKGFVGHYTDRAGVTYLETIDAVYKSITEASEEIDFIEVDCPFNYYRQTRTRNDDDVVDNAKKFLALQEWCDERGVKFYLIVNTEPGYVDANSTEEVRERANKRFQEDILEYIRQIRKDGIFPDSFLIQSWYKAPTTHLPESEKYTFMNTALETIDLIHELYPRE